MSGFPKIFLKFATAFVVAFASLFFLISTNLFLCAVNSMRLSALLKSSCNSTNYSYEIDFSRVNILNFDATERNVSTSFFSASNSARDTVLVSANTKSGNAAASANMSFFIVGCPLSLSVVGTRTLYHNQNGAMA